MPGNILALLIKIINDCCSACHFRRFSLTITRIYAPSYPVNNDCEDVDELILEIAGYKNDHCNTAAEKLFRKCSTSWDAYQ